MVSSGETGRHPHIHDEGPRGSGLTFLCWCGLVGAVPDPCKGEKRGQAYGGGEDVIFLRVVRERESRRTGVWAIVRRDGRRSAMRIMGWGPLALPPGQRGFPGEKGCKRTPSIAPVLPRFPRDLNEIHTYPLPPPQLQGRVWMMSILHALQRAVTRRPQARTESGEIYTLWQYQGAIPCVDVCTQDDAELDRCAFCRCSSRISTVPIHRIRSLIHEPSQNLPRYNMLWLSLPGERDINISPA